MMISDICKNVILCVVILLCAETAAARKNPTKSQSLSVSVRNPRSTDSELNIYGQIYDRRRPLDSPGVVRRRGFGRGRFGPRPRCSRKIRV